jgi:hypothetical protein
MSNPITIVAVVVGLGVLVGIVGYVVWKRYYKKEVVD